MKTKSKSINIQLILIKKLKQWSGHWAIILENVWAAILKFNFSYKESWW